MGGRLEPFSLVHVVLYPGRGSLYTITGVDTVRTFQGMRERLFRLEEGARLLEVVRRLFPEEEEHPDAFNLLVRAVGRLSRSADRGEAARVVLATRVKLLLALGYLPELESCVQCGSDEYLCSFRPSAGGVLCRDCTSGEGHDCFHISEAGLGTLRMLLERPLADALSAGLEPQVTAEVERTVNQVLAHHGH
jgi:DNA repair protein RecO (recombination protein O)